MTRDPIVEEVRTARRETEEACGGDWDRLVKHYVEIQNRSDHAVVRGSPKHLVQAPAHKPGPP